MLRMYADESTHVRAKCASLHSLSNLCATNGTAFRRMFSALARWLTFVKSKRWSAGFLSGMSNILLADRLDKLVKLGYCMYCGPASSEASIAFQNTDIPLCV